MKQMRYDELEESEVLDLQLICRLKGRSVAPHERSVTNGEF